MISISERLRQARIDAGYTTMSAAAEQFGWKVSTYGGHENGSRGIKTRDIQKYAAAFGVSPAWLLTGSRGAAASIERPAAAPPGMAEPAVIPYLARTDSEHHAILALADHSHPPAQHPALHKVTRPVPALGLLRGDILVIDAKPTPQNGQIVLVQAQDRESGEAETHAAIFHKGQAVPAFGETDFSDDDIVVMGAVCATVRLR